MSNNRDSGSRYLYEPFDTNRARIDANEKVQEERWDALERRLDSIEKNIDRVDKRLWILVYGIVGVVLSRFVSSLAAFSNII